MRLQAGLTRLQASRLLDGMRGELRVEMRAQGGGEGRQQRTHERRLAAARRAVEVEAERCLRPDGGAQRDARGRAVAEARGEPLGEGRLDGLHWQGGGCSRVALETVAHPYRRPLPYYSSATCRGCLV